MKQPQLNNKKQKNYLNNNEDYCQALKNNVKTRHNRYPNYFTSLYSKIKFIQHFVPLTRRNYSPDELNYS